MTASTNGKVYYGRRDAKTGRFIPAGSGNQIDYVFGKLKKTANLGSKLIYNELVKMSTAFLDSYVSGMGGSKLPEDTGNLIDSTSIHVARGEYDTSRKYNDRYSYHVAQAHAAVPQTWGNWGYIQRGAGFGADYRANSIEEVLDTRITEGYRKADVAVALHVGIPYAGPLDLFGAHSQQTHKGFFRDMAKDFRNDVMEISVEVASAMEKFDVSEGGTGVRGIGRDL
jgi:hypothetical protein